MLKTINHPAKNKGFSYIELVLSVLIATILVLGLMGILTQGQQAAAYSHEKNQLNRQARFAMDRMVRAVNYTRLILLPLNDVPATNWPENIRQQSVPPQAPVGDSILATAVLAVTLPAYQDIDNDGFPDADDDKDGQIDEDIPADRNYDFAPGIYLIDDDGDGLIDEDSNFNDDEGGNLHDEDPIDGIDNDNDNNIDEDNPTDMNKDGCPGFCGVDDDGDGLIDEGSVFDNDEDGTNFDDWYNPVVFYMDNGQLLERTPVPWDETGVSGITGQDFLTSVIAENVTFFRVERIKKGINRYAMIDLTLEISSPKSALKIRLQTRIRAAAMY